jgi:DNA-binding MarR family transcriptional regulator
VLGHLERRGYLAREPDPTDNRSRRIRLTDAGRDLEAVIWNAARKAESDAAALIGARRMDSLRRALQDLITLLP